MPRPLLRRLQASFGCDLSHVRLHRGPAAARLAAEAGGIACALGARDIFLGPVTAPLLPAVLAHEVAHLMQQRLMQQRLPGPAGDRRAAEAEAHAAARAALAGQGFRPRVALDPRDPACWEEAGHYYTVYFVLLACGVRDPLARQVAFYCQLPDEISELDAVRAGYAIAGTAVTGGGVGDWLYENTVGQVEEMLVTINNGIADSVGIPGGMMRARREPRDPVAPYRSSLDVQQGLHALTGGSSATETAARRAIVMGIDPVRNTFEFGVALHVFGDSYAHRDRSGGAMYAPVAGHAPDSLAARGGSDRHVHPDGIGPYRRVTYEAYVGDLHDMFSARFSGASRSGGTMPRDRTIRTLSAIVAGDDHAADTDPMRAAQISMIRAAAASLGGMHPYAPEATEDVPFSIFSSGSSGITVTRVQVDRALALARYWSSPGSFAGSSALPALP
ncbi:DUF4157 domain-containing protein [Roseomonas sp. CAU 1739]|uniref:eCIS core domain-containing protein n=1 Tax=Roseomonas sp. CAU 1739 TaxID=3140364 RepID=UPI00325A9DF7